MTVLQSSLLIGFNESESTVFENTVYATVFCANLGEQLPKSFHHSPDSILKLITDHSREEILDLKIFENIDTPLKVVFEGIAQSYYISFDEYEEYNVLNMLELIRKAYSQGTVVDIVIFNAMRIAYERLGIELVNSDIVFDFFIMAMTTGNKFHDAILNSRSDTLAQLFAEELLARIN